MRRSFFVFIWYASKAVLKRFWKLAGEVVVEETLDIVSVSMLEECGRGEMVSWWYRSIGLILLLISACFVVPLNIVLIHLVASIELGVRQPSERS